MAETNVVQEFITSECATLPEDITFSQAQKLIRAAATLHFRRWMGGQTGPFVTKTNGKSVPGVYKSDVQRYLELVFCGKPKFFD